MAPPINVASGSETWITDTSPLILLAKVGQLSLLETAARQVLVTDVVEIEVLTGARSDPARIALEAGWGTRVVSPPTPPSVEAFGLDAGETSVLALALSSPGARRSTTSEGGGPRTH